MMKDQSFDMAFHESEVSRVMSSSPIINKSFDIVPKTEAVASQLPASPIAEEEVRAEDEEAFPRANAPASQSSGSSLSSEFDDGSDLH